MPDLERDPRRASELCRTAHERLLRTATALRPEEVSIPSRLPGWTVGHVLTHLARNADAHARRLEGTLRGEDVRVRRSVTTRSRRAPVAGAVADRRRPPDISACPAHLRAFTAWLSGRGPLDPTTTLTPW